MRDMTPGRAAAFLMAATLAACATPEPDPCTPQWVEWKKDQVLSNFASTYRSDIRALRNLEGDLQNPSVIAAIRLAGRAQSVGDMADTFISETVPDLQASLEPCLAAPLSASTLMADLLETQNVDPTVIAWVQALGAFMDAAPSLSEEAG
ncbi:MAG: hypothetical protein AAF253_00605 [Pseudomonadota bacterium]